MRNFKIQSVTNLKEIESLANQSALTFEGLNCDDKGLNSLVEWLKDNDALTEDDLVFHIISGKLMNDEYKLTNQNKYPDDLTIVSVTGIDLIKVTLPRFQVGGRWLDDIIENNLRRELEM